MKKVLSLLFALIIALSSLFVSFPAYSADSPLLFSSSLSGKIISATDVYVVKRKNCTPSYTEKKGKRFTLSRGKSFAILGKDKRGGSKVYARLNINKITYYGYIKRHYIKIIGLKNYDTGTDIKYNSYYKRKMKYPYAEYKDMPFYQFNQTDKKGSINGLRLPYSCGPHSLACVLSALHGDVITPECIMKNMSRRAPNP
ncbi:MAG: hypothetical protein IJ235_07445, partial [Eubacterium sp.]|nr:hypothetical protein [Eubacterium sp.]